MKLKTNYFIKFVGVFAAVFLTWFFNPRSVSAAILSASPSTGTFTVGSTFDVSILIDTEHSSINAVEASLSFPPDKIQLVSPSSGKSLLGVWTLQPSVNNQTGRLDL